jgi:hypothetical protein
MNKKGRHIEKMSDTNTLESILKVLSAAGVMVSPADQIRVITAYIESSKSQSPYNCGVNAFPSQGVLSEGNVFNTPDGAEREAINVNNYTALGDVSPRQARLPVEGVKPWLNSYFNKKCEQVFFFLLTKYGKQRHNELYKILDGINNEWAAEW